ncbi:MAG: CNNM domain-containing protein [Verrucomicrobiota bacterium]
MSWPILLLVTLALSFALSGLESAVLAVSRVRVRHAARAGDRRAARLLPLLEDRDALLGSITVANHVVNLFAFVIIASKLVNVSGGWGYLTAFVVALPIFLICLEILPKKLFRRYPFRSIRTLAPLVHLVGLMRPFFRFFARREMSADASSGTPDVSAGREDLRQQARSLQKLGQLSPGTGHLIEQVLNYRRLRAVDLMRPLKRSVALSPDLPLSAAQIMAREHDRSTLPVIGEKGVFVGVIDLSSLPAVVPPDRLVRQHMRTLDVVNETDGALLALQRLRKRGRSLCLVVDSRSEPSGLLHEEDLLRHLMGMAS